MSLAESLTPNSVGADDRALGELAQLASRISLGIVDVAGFLDDIDAMTARQVSEVSGVSRGANSVLSANEMVREALKIASESASQMSEDVRGSVEFVQSANQRIRAVATWVKALSDQMEAIARTLTATKKTNDEISRIAAQVNILAINAKIEAMRAGQEGRGFAVVAEAINELSRKTANAAADISGNIDTLSRTLESLRQESTEVRADADHVLDDTDHTSKSLNDIQEKAADLTGTTNNMQREAENVHDIVTGFVPASQAIQSGITKTAEGVHDTRNRVHALVDASEAIVQKSVELGGALEDGKFVQRVIADARQIGELFARALATGEITAEALFDTHYTPIPGTDPQQVMARFTKLTDRLLPAIQEPPLDFDPRVIFCASVDLNGYLPTHNIKFSQPQGNDPVWNTANCRNRRIFDDRVGLKAGRSTAKFLVQAYRRDMGGGNFALMKDISAPITVNGRHWGGLRLAYKI